MLSPANYAARFLPVKVSSSGGTLPVRIDRYRLGAPITPAQQQLWGALGDHFHQHKSDHGYKLTLTVNNAPFPVANREMIRMPAVRPFYGKGSPEDCQVVLQVALILGLTTAASLQSWADTHLGLDCNGYVGNYLFHNLLGKSWWINDGKNEPGPSMTIDGLFDWALKTSGLAMVTDLDDLDASRSYLIVRSDAAGNVVPGPDPVGHVAVSEPGKLVTDFRTMMDLTRADDGLTGRPAVQTYESAGEKMDGIHKGLHSNWMIFTHDTKVKGVFKATRDNIRKVDFVKIAPLP